MNKKYFKFSVYLLPLLVCLFLLSVVSVQAATIKYTPNITIPDSDFISGKSIDITADTLAIYIREVYRYGGVIAGAFAMFMLVYASWQWLMAGGNASKVAMAKDTINTTLVGLAFLFGGYLLLTQISVNLVSFQPLVIPIPNIKDNINQCHVDTDCKSGYICMHEIYGANNSCQNGTIAYINIPCADNGSRYGTVDRIESKCACREQRVLNQIQCRQEFIDSIDDYCASTYVSLSANNDGCASYLEADACRSNICYGKKTRTGQVFNVICGVSLNSMQQSGYVPSNDCRKITDVSCNTNMDCVVGNDLGNMYCCADRNNAYDYCRLRTEEGVVCKGS